MPFRPCRTVLEQVSDIVDGEAGLAARMRFHSHLALCSHCRTYYRQFLEVKEACGVVTPEDVPEDFDSVMAGLIAEIGLDDGSN